MRRGILIALAVTSVLGAACGGDEGLSEQIDGAATDTTVAAEDGDADEGPGFGDVIDATIQLTGSVDETFTPNPGERFIVGGGCQGESFGMQIAVFDEAEQQSSVAVLVDGFDAGLAGGQTGTFELDDLEVQVFDTSDGLRIISYKGPGTMDLTVHEAPTEPNDRRMSFTISGDDLENEDNETLSVSVDLDWVMGCT